MPGYPGAGQAKLINYNQQRHLWNVETVPVGGASIAFQLRRIEGMSYPFGASFELRFGGAPGVFEVDIQTADTDTDSSYVTINVINSGLNSSNVGRLELVFFYAKFVRAKVIALANVVPVTVLVTR